MRKPTNNKSFDLFRPSSDLVEQRILGYFKLDDKLGL